MKNLNNGIATIKFNPIFDAIEIHFNDQGTMESYHNTMAEGLNMALLENVNRWIFIKDSFGDINTDQFLSFLRKWIVKGCQLLKSKGLAPVCEVAVITKAQLCEKLKLQFDFLQNGKEPLELLDFNVCQSEEEIYEYF